MYIAKLSPTYGRKYRIFPALMLSLEEDSGSLLYD